jgi:hypothetical protein
MRQTPLTDAEDQVLVNLVVRCRYTWSRTVPDIIPKMHRTLGAVLYCVETGAWIEALQYVGLLRTWEAGALGAVSVWQPLQEAVARAALGEPLTSECECVLDLHRLEVEVIDEWSAWQVVDWRLASCRQSDFRFVLERWVFACTCCRAVELDRVPASAEEAEALENVPLEYAEGYWPVDAIVTVRRLKRAIAARRYEDYRRLVDAARARAK